MKASKILAGASMLLALPAFAKITVFTTDDVVAHVLKSKELTNLRRQGLVQRELVSISVAVNGNGVGEVYTVNLDYSNVRGGLPENCQFTATVKNEKAPAPGGITANRLSAPRLSVPECAE